jgi:hypothetical protein
MSLPENLRQRASSISPAILTTVWKRTLPYFWVILEMPRGLLLMTQTASLWTVTMPTQH